MNSWEPSWFLQLMDSVGEKRLTLNSLRMFATMIETPLKEAPITPATGCWWSWYQDDNDYHCCFKRRLISICSKQAFNRTISYKRKFGSTEWSFLKGHIYTTLQWPWRQWWEPSWWWFQWEATLLRTSLLINGNCDELESKGRNFAESRR